MQKFETIQQPLLGEFRWGSFFLWPRESKVNSQDSPGVGVWPYISLFAWEWVTNNWSFWIRNLSMPNFFFSIEWTKSLKAICLNVWCHMRHLMSNDAYDINIWHMSILTILVSNEASGPQQLHMWIQFWLQNCLKIHKLKSGFGIFFLYKFWKSFVFYAKTLFQISVDEKCIKSSCFFYLFTHGSKKHHWVGTF
jgi:hypothetical protein